MKKNKYLVLKKKVSKLISIFFKDDLDILLYDLIEVIGEKNLNIFFDIGAHKGKVLRKIYKKNKSSIIYAFEPFPSSYKELEKLTKKIPGINIFQYAVSSHKGVSNLFINNFSETNSLLRSNKINSSIDDLTCNIDKIEVKTTTLDLFCLENKINHIDFLKLDTQGSEMQILRGSENLLRRKAISAIYCEVEFLEIYKDQCLFDEIFQYLRQYHYEFYKFYNLNYIENGRLAWSDALFIVNNQGTK